ncbi:MAG: hypothetical protein Q7R48_00640 [bacterium]|nr:hypothetical protein [bacterium]
MAARRILVSRLEPVSFYEGLESRDFIQGLDLQRRIQELKALCSRSDAEDIVDQPDEIPKSWENFMFLFPHGDPQGQRRRSTLTFLFYADGKWQLGDDSLAIFQVRWTLPIRCLRMRERTVA